jgi:DNA-binding HxlR family transcriptional regulator
MKNTSAKLTKKERIIRTAIFKGVRNIGHLKTQMDMYEKDLMRTLRSLKNAGLVDYQIMGRKVLLTPSKKAVQMFL